MCCARKLWFVNCLVTVWTTARAVASYSKLELISYSVIWPLVGSPLARIVSQRPSGLALLVFCRTMIDSCGLENRSTEGYRTKMSSAQYLVFPSLYARQGTMHRYQCARALFCFSCFCRSTLYNNICIRQPPSRLLLNGLERISVGQLSLLKNIFCLQRSVSLWDDKRQYVWWHAEIHKLFFLSMVTAFASLMYICNISFDDIYRCNSFHILLL